MFNQEYQSFHEQQDEADRRSSVVIFDLIKSLVSQYDSQKAELTRVSEFMSAESSQSTIGYFLSGNGDDRSGLRVAALFALDGAVKALNSDFWQRALSLTDILDAMPADMRMAWHDQIRDHQCPDFEEQAVRSTLADLGARRKDFIGERVEAIFKNLSPDHKTNLPNGFSKRFIIQHALDSLGYVESTKASYISDLRQIIAKITKRDASRHGETNAALSIAARRIGQWVDLDGWALRVKFFRIGTCHLEVHPDIAWRLNELLSLRHPNQIPSGIRTPPARTAKTKEFQLILRPLPFAVLNTLQRELRRKPHSLTDYWFSKSSVTDKFTVKEAEAVIHAIGGAFTSACEVSFDYDPADTLEHIYLTGCIPDIKSHQFYPTPASIAAEAIQMADIGPMHTVLEPSAGQGGLASLLDARRTLCVEISKLHSKILEAKGFKVVTADFLSWGKTAHQFDRVVMNPPFSDGRAQQHLEMAASLLAPDGVLVAILPASMKGKAVLEGWCCEWSKVYSNEFDGTGVSVCILKATRTR